MRTFLLPLLLLAAAAAAAHAAGKPPVAADPAVRSLTYTGKEAGQNGGAEADAIKMPFVRLADAAVARRINDQVFVSQMGVLAPKNPGATFAAADKQTVSGTASLEFTVARHDARVLTLAFEREGCGAYCEEDAEAFTFDLRTGRAVGPDDLLTPAGQRALDRQMDAARKAAYRKQIASFGGAPKKPAKGAQKPSDDDGNDVDDRIELATTCLAQVSSEAPQRSAPLEGTRIEVDVDALVLTHERCSNHAMRALDDVDEVSLKVPYATLAPHLTPFGKSLLLGDGDAPQADDIYGRMLYGTLGGKTPIAMRLRVDSDGSIGGAYYYEKFGTPIELGGARRGRHLELVEHLSDKNDDTHDGAKLSLDATGARLTGRWIGDKQFDVELAP
jgi:hypothetical protein